MDPRDISIEFVSPYRNNFLFWTFSYLNLLDLTTQNLKLFQSVVTVQPLQNMIH